jgi:hypothetical protein
MAMRRMMKPKAIVKRPAQRRIAAPNAKKLESDNIPRAPEPKRKGRGKSKPFGKLSEKMI